MSSSTVLLCFALGRKKTKLGRPSTHSSLFWVLPHHAFLLGLLRWLRGGVGKVRQLSPWEVSLFGFTNPSEVLFKAGAFLSFPPYMFLF